MSGALSFENTLRSWGVLRTLTTRDGCHFREYPQVERQLPYLSRLPLRFEHWDPAFLAYCKQLEKKKPVIFNGDLNVAHTELDLANPGPNRGKKGFTDEERKGFQNFVDAGFVDTFRLFKQGNGYYTWWSNFANARSRNIGWRIDYVLVSSALRNAVKGCRHLSGNYGKRSLSGQYHDRRVGILTETHRPAPHRY